MEVKEMLEGKFKKTRTKPTINKNNNKYKRLQVGGTSSNKGYPNIVPKSNQCEKFLNLKDSGTLLLARPMQAKTTNIRRNGPYYE